MSFWNLVVIKLNRIFGQPQCIWANLHNDLCIKYILYTFRANFNPELASNRVVRLIFNGQLLNRDNSTLGQYGLFDNCVVHCHISQPQPTNSNEVTPNTANQENDGLDISEILVSIPIFGLHLH